MMLNVTNSHDALSGTYTRCPKWHIFMMVWFMAFNATFNNISVISWCSVLLEEETGVSGENH